MKKKPECSSKKHATLRMLTTALFLLWSTGLLAQDPGEESRHVAPETIEVIARTGPYTCPYCDLKGLDLSGRDLTNANLTGANLRGADFRGATLDGISLSGANLENANFDRATLDRSKEGNADLSRADLRGAAFRGAELHYTDFQYADLKGSDFSGTDLSAVVFGPKIHAGVLPDGRKTSFREARLRRGFELDEATMDLRDVVWVGDPDSDAVGDGSEEETVCGKADITGLTSRTYVGSSGTDSGSCGASYASPCKTIEKGIERCAESGCGVLVTWGQYAPATSVALTQGKNLYGGCLPKSLANPDYFSVVNGPADGQPAITAAGIDVATLVQGFQLVGSTGAPWDATIALNVSNSAALTMANVEILAGAGADGEPGLQGPPGEQGADANGRTGGTPPFLTDSDGGDGAYEMGVHVHVRGTTSCKMECTNECWGYPGKPSQTGIWSSGGQWGKPNCNDECPKSRGHTGHPGAKGANGACGSLGSASSDTTGAFYQASSDTTGASHQRVWHCCNPPAQPGQQGVFGAGGGGGGSGGYTAGSCFWVKVEHNGNAGGGGGAGAIGATGGWSGSPGGASFAVVLRSSTVTFKDSRLVGGRSGDGGDGGAGGDGKKGGKGAGGATSTAGGYGGKGGDGGTSGGGGGGGGANSGPAVTVVKLGSSAINTHNTALKRGAAGTAGSGGQSGTSGDGTSCLRAPDGISGLVTGIYQY